MSNQTPFLEDLKRELLTHAPGPSKGPLTSRRAGTRLSGAWLAVVVFAATLLVGGLTWILAGRDSMPSADTSLQGPALEWRRIDPPSGIDRVRTLWVDTEGDFAIWTGAEIWTSPDGDAWDLRASDSPVAALNQMHPVAQLGDGWVVAGAGGSGEPVVVRTSDGATWSTSELPVSSPSNDLLVSRTQTVAVAARPGGLVVVGAVTTGVNEEALIERVAPDLADTGEIRYSEGSIDILDSNGTVRDTVPFSDIDPRLAEQRGVVLETIIWNSTDGDTWERVDLIDGAGPTFLGADEKGYKLAIVDRVLVDSDRPPATRFLGSPNGVDWTEYATFEGPTLGVFALVNGDLISAGQPDVTLQRVQADGSSVTISGGPAFEDEDIADLTASQVAAGEYGIVAAAFDATLEITPHVALWYSPEGQQWNRQNTQEVFGSEGNLLVAVGEDRVLVAHDSQGEAGSAIDSPFELWVGTVGG
jgi:hypothetical protein